jgi:precorrin-8X/cobalt-precorrin-8 methylmutase
VEKPVAQRLVYASGDWASVDDLFFSPGAVEAGIRALLRCRSVVADVTLVDHALQRRLLQAVSVSSWCGAEEREASLLAHTTDLTNAAAGIRLARERFGNDVVLALGEAPSAVLETLRLIKENSWRPQLVIGLPVGFVGAVECKEQLRKCLQVPRITNAGPRGGAVWTAAVVNALLIAALHREAAVRMQSSVTMSYEEA